MQSLAYVGAYSNPGNNWHGEGLTVFQLNSGSSDWLPIQIVKTAGDPSFLMLDQQKRYLYCVYEHLNEVSAFRIDEQTGQLTWLNTQPSGGDTPASLTLDPTNCFVLVANYNSGTLTTFPILENGSLGSLCNSIQLSGQLGPDPIEQTTSHPHQLCFDPTGQYLMVPDKGLDEVFSFKFEAENGRLIPNSPPSVKTQAGAGPRHLAFHPNAALAYVINELDSTIISFKYDAQHGQLEFLQLVSALPADFSGTNTTAEIMVSPDGKFVYGSNRGHDSIVVFEVDAVSGKLSPIQWQSTYGKTPRFFTLDTNGEFLYVANQDSDTIKVFQIDRPTGKLSPTGQAVAVGNPVYIVFV